MSLTVLALVQAFCREAALPVPTALQGSSDAGALQLREIVTQVGEELWGRTNWQACCIRSVWTSVAGEDQGVISTLFPLAFQSIVPQTFWDMSLRRPMYGPVADGNWQWQKAMTPAGPIYAFRVDGGHLRVTSSMPAGHSLSLFYKYYNWINSATASVFSADSDTCIFSDRLMKAGLRAFWLRKKLLPHAWEMQQFDDMAASEGSTETVKPILRMDGNGEIGPFPAGIMIPIGNWTY